MSTVSEPPRPAWLLLHGTDVNPTRPIRPRSRIVLLHGWLQDHTAWLPTALALRDLYGHSVLLLDFYGHGLSATPSSDVSTPAGWTQLVQERVAAVGWDRGAPVVMGGCSLGAAVAMRYLMANPGRVQRLVLVAPAGLPEPAYMPCHPVRAAARALVAAAPDSARWLDVLRVILTTPEYGFGLRRLPRIASVHAVCFPDDARVRFPVTSLIASDCLWLMSPEHAARGHRGVWPQARRIECLPGMAWPLRRCFAWPRRVRAASSCTAPASTLSTRRAPSGGEPPPPAATLPPLPPHPPPPRLPPVPRWWALLQARCATRQARRPCATRTSPGARTGACARTCISWAFTRTRTFGTRWITGRAIGGTLRAPRRHGRSCDSGGASALQRLVVGSTPRALAIWEFLCSKTLREKKHKSKMCRRSAESEQRASLVSALDSAHSNGALLTHY